MPVTTMPLAFPHREKALSFRVPRGRRPEMLARLKELGFQARRTLIGRIAVEYEYRDERRLFDFVNDELPCTSVRIWGLSPLTSSDFS